MRRTRRIALVTLAVVAAVAAAAAWRWMPRQEVPATAAMRTASSTLVTASKATMSPSPSPPAHPATDRQRLLAAAFSLRGKPYKWGAKGPEAYDCSGFTKAAYAATHVKLPDGSYNQAKGEVPLADPALMKPGDLILYRWAGSRGVKHVTMYAGDGWVIGVGSPGQPPVVTLFPLKDDLVNDGRILTYRRIRLPDER